MRRTFAASLAILLAAHPFAPAAAQEPAAAAAPLPLSVAHSPVGCMVAGTNPQLDAGISPDDRVQAGRVYFHSVLSTAFYYVEMMPQAGRYVGVLPKPRADAGPVTYYVEGVGRDYSQTQTAEQSAVVVEKAEDCRDKPLAALGPGDPVRVFSVTGGRRCRRGSRACRPWWRRARGRARPRPERRGPAPPPAAGSPARPSQSWGARWPWAWPRS